MDKCYEIENYKDKLSQITNESNLSIGMIQYVIYDFYKYINELYKATYKEEQQILLKNLENKEENNKNEQQTLASVD